MVASTLENKAVVRTGDSWRALFADLNDGVRPVVMAALLFLLGVLEGLGRALPLSTVTEVGGSQHEVTLLCSVASARGLGDESMETFMFFVT